MFKQCVVALCSTLMAGFLVSCDSGQPQATANIVMAAKAGKEEKKEAGSFPVPLEKLAVPEAEIIMSRPQVPILCYHQVRDYRPADSKSARDYIVPVAAFREQMKALSDSGYTTILPEQLYRYLVAGEPLPQKPVIISFDDGCDEQFPITAEILDPLNFKAAFFIMTVSVNRPNFMTGGQIRELAEKGHSIGLHTWDHHNVKKYAGDDWVTQVEKPKLQLEKITGRPIQFFAYPFGLWNEAAVPELKSRGMIAAFQLSTPRDQSSPLHTIRRIIVTGDWSGPQLIKRMSSSFDGGK
ncbi:polysaccharide deacetylase family protein [Flavihumibacter stibioxidans]|uniref:NodB homology domain-containing protein n=1 Tax=Flavihumibacter stibioxidans TaxID=1834163 RepID=A0ABR7MDP1_9BACT|nr:polysaccharide deacetylase family protein [Flavihumibacter stibioxidans]MBC6493076.1 hypothetical protein [Flavihumibacter stibioxidans]